MHSLPILGLGIAFALLGLALFAVTLRKSAASTAPVKKSEQRVLEARKSETNKLRIGAAMLVALGAALMAIS